jgi:membrane protein
MKRPLHLLKDAAGRWSDDQCYRFGASLSYYAVFSIFPLLLLCITAFGFVMGRDASVGGRVLDYVSKSSVPELRPLLGETLTSMQAHKTARGVGAAVGVVTLFFGASGVFSELEATLNVVWRVRAPKTRSIWQMLLEVVRGRALAFVVVLGAGVALLFSLLVSTALSALDTTLREVGRGPVAWLLVETVVSIGLLTALFAAMYRMIPRTAVEWRDVFFGALIAAVLFTALKHILAWYLGHIGSYAAYGAVGGILGLLTWIYLASLILFFGAEVTRVYAERYGSLVGYAHEGAPGASSRHFASRFATYPSFLRLAGRHENDGGRRRRRGRVRGLGGLSRLASEGTVSR